MRKPWLLVVCAAATLLWFAAADEPRPAEERTSPTARVAVDQPDTPQREYVASADKPPSTPAAPSPSGVATAETEPESRPEDETPPAPSPASPAPQESSVPPWPRPLPPAQAADERTRREHVLAWFESLPDGDRQALIERLELLGLPVPNEIPPASE